MVFTFKNDIRDMMNPIRTRKWFAWHPVNVLDGPLSRSYVWLEFVNVEEQKNPLGLWEIIGAERIVEARKERDHD